MTTTHTDQHFSFKVINETSKPYIHVNYCTLLCLLGLSNINFSPTNLGSLCSTDKGRHSSTHSIGPLWQGSCNFGTYHCPTFVTAWKCTRLRQALSYWDIDHTVGLFTWFKIQACCQSCQRIWLITMGRRGCFLSQKDRWRSWWISTKGGQIQLENLGWVY